MIISSLLDTDYYKFNMNYVFYRKFPDVIAEYRFKCRNKGIPLTEIEQDLKEEIKHLCSLKLKTHELNYLESLGHFNKGYIEFLRLLQLNEKFVTVKAEKDLSITIKGPISLTTYFEVPILAIVNELYFRKFDVKSDNPKILRDRSVRLNKKIKLVNETNDLNLNFKFADFGTRRRFSKEWHEEIVKRLKEKLPDNFVGTSNVWLALHNGLKPIGTQAHEYIELGQSLGVKLKDSQKYMLQTWADVYRGDLGVALTDTLGVDAFLNDFDLYFAKLFDGLRHDSGDPYEWTEKIIKHYNNLGIDPKTKTAVYSDGLNFPKAIEIAKRYSGMINCSFGIGTNLTNDVIGTPLNIVIKLIRANGEPVAKISDSSGKQMCDDKTHLNYLKRTFRIK